MKRATIAAFASGIAAGTALIISCGMGPDNASATGGCSNWEVTHFKLAEDCGTGTKPYYPATCRIPDGWEPIMMSNNTYDAMILRRCAP